MLHLSVLWSSWFRFLVTNSDPLVSECFKHVWFENFIYKTLHRRELNISIFSEYHSKKLIDQIPHPAVHFTEQISFFFLTFEFFFFGFTYYTNLSPEASHFCDMIGPFCVYFTIDQHPNKRNEIAMDISLVILSLSLFTVSFFFFVSYGIDGCAIFFIVRMHKISIWAIAGSDNFAARPNLLRVR